MPEPLEANDNFSLFGELKNTLNTFIDKLESEQSKINKAMFEALTQEQRSIYCQSLKKQGIKSTRIEKITGKSQSTINRHLNK